MDTNRLQLQSSSPQTPGDLGFKLIGESKQSPGKLARLWLRRKRAQNRHVWTRYLDPRMQSREWEVRLHIEKGTGAMTHIEFHSGKLKELAEEFEFPQNPSNIATLQGIQSDDPVFTMIRDWVVEVTGSAS